MAHELLKRTTPLKIKQTGYVYIYLSNENETPVEVFFDDFKVEQIKSPVIQTNDYYPFGLTFNSYQRENSVDQKYLYNGKELQDQLDLGRLDYGARAYMPDIGRWTTLDPLLEKFNSFSPYSYCLNNPIVLVDPDGMASRYNWETGTYYDDEDDDGQQDDGERTTTWGQVQKEYGKAEKDGNRNDEKNGGDPGGSSESATAGAAGNGGPGDPPNWNMSSFAYASGASLVLLGDDVTGVGVVDDVAIPFIYAGATTVFLYQNKGLIAKHAREVANLLKRAAGPQGFMYTLVVNAPGTYLDVRGMPVTVNAGDVWKFGETTSSSRYSQSELNSMIPGGVTMVPTFFGNQVEIKVAEKAAIYGYFFQNGSLPPGNRIFR